MILGAGHQVFLVQGPISLSAIWAAQSILCNPDDPVYSGSITRIFPTEHGLV